MLGTPAQGTIFSGMLDQALAHLRLHVQRADEVQTAIHEPLGRQVPLCLEPINELRECPGG